MKKLTKGFTLIEILVVMGIIAVLAAIVLVAINPARQFAQARDTQRTSNVSAISNAIGQFMADNEGDLPTGIPVGEADTKPGVYDLIGDGSGEADLCDQLVPDYMPAFPVDPDTDDGEAITDCSATYDTGYSVIQDDDDSRVTVCAFDVEIEDEICVTR